MTLLIDANILLDVLQERKPYSRDSSLIWKLCETGQTKGYLSSLTFANIVYIMRKRLTPEQIETVLRSLKLIFTFVDLTASDLTNAAQLKWNDFEDAIHSVIADRIRADYIVTRNKADFVDSKVSAATPNMILKQFTFENENLK